MPDHRAHFDFDIRFANCGDLTGTGFRLDVPSADLDRGIHRPAAGASPRTYAGRQVELRGLRIVEEPHRGSRGVESATGDAKCDNAVVDLSHPIRAGLVTYPGLPAPTITPHLTREDSRGSTRREPSSRWTSSR